MLVVGTSREEFEAVWVKNEWSRFLDLMKRDSSKSLICVYRDMSPYELPSELGYLQGMDLAKIGAQQDLLRGIRKIVQSSPGDKPVRHESGAANAAAENGSAPFSSSESQNMGDRIAHGKTERDSYIWRKENGTLRRAALTPHWISTQRTVMPTWVSSLLRKNSDGGGSGIRRRLFGE